jgi:hypothetical protein
VHSWHHHQWHDDLDGLFFGQDDHSTTVKEACRELAADHRFAVSRSIVCLP